MQGERFRDAAYVRRLISWSLFPDCIERRWPWLIGCTWGSSIRPAGDPTQLQADRRKMESLNLLVIDRGRHDICNVWFNMIASRPRETLKGW